MNKSYKPVRVYLMRHGKTALNREHFFQKKNTPLLIESREKILKTAKYFEESGIKTVLCSDYLRAEETARIIASQMGVNVEISSLFGEIRRPSEIQEKSHYNPRSLFVMGVLLMNAGRRKWHYSNEENPSEHYTRMKKALEYIHKHSTEKKEKEMIVVSHRTSIVMLVLLMRRRRRILSLFLTTPLAFLAGVKNADILVCDFDGEKWYISPFE